MRDYKFITQLKSLPFVERIILFGSRARGDHRETSDIDLAIIGDKIDANAWLDILHIINNADTLLRIDCVQFNTLPSDSPLRKNILSEGIILYDKNHH